MMARFAQAMSTTAARLSLLFLLLFSATAIALAFYVTALSARIIESEARGAINADLDALQVTLADQGLPGLIRALDRQARQPGAHLLLMTDGTGRALLGNILAVSPGVLDAKGWVEQPFEYIRDGSDDVYSAIARIEHFPNGLTLLVGRDVRDSERFRAVIRQSLMMALGVMTLGGLAIWLLVGRRALQRIDLVSRESRRIIGGDLSRRLPIGGSGDEFDRLSASLNGLLDRIASLDRGVRELSSNVAHDLKTPLTRLKARTEAALRQPARQAGMRRALEDNLAETERLIRTFEAMLTISRLESGNRLQGLEKVPLRPLMADVAELFEPVAQEQGVQITTSVDAGLTVTAQRELLAQCITNLVDNALRHGGPSMHDIRISVSTDANETSIEVTDDGAGIAPGQHEALIERFARGDASRSSDGSGLGLSLVKAFAEALGGTFTLENADPGLRAVIRLPNG
jgi:signal transduction histidine kinase